jgi:fucose permease
MGSLLLALIYLCFISLGLPDSLLGSSWPVLHAEISVPVSYAGFISVTITVGTILSSFFSNKLLHKFGAGLVTAISITTTALCLFGFSISTQFWMLILWAIPFGLGAGGVDAILNNYVALHFKAQHMSWLHCMWGVGAAAGPYMMGILLSGGQHWSRGYLFIGIAQIILSAALFLSLPLWKKAEQNDRSEPLSLKQVMLIPGARQVMITFFCYCALEQTAALWSASYFHLHGGFTADEAASLGSLFFLGITLGRAISGFITIKLNDASMIRLGFIITAVGIVLLCIPCGHFGAVAGILLVGLGCAPIYPCMMHATPEHFGSANSQALMGIQTASAYIGTAFMPPLFGLITNHISISLMGIYLLTMLVFMIFSHRKLIGICKKAA